MSGLPLFPEPDASPHPLVTALRVAVEVCGDERYAGYVDGCLSEHERAYRRAVADVQRHGIEHVLGNLGALIEASAPDFDSPGRGDGAVTPEPVATNP